MPGLPQDFFVEGYAREQFHAGYLALWAAIEAEGLSPEKVISRWTGRHRSTVYEWRKDENMPQRGDLWRLVYASSADGFDQLARRMVAPFFALTQSSRALVNGTFRDEVMDLSECAGDLAKIERTGGSERALMIAEDLRQIADRVEAQARQSLTPLQATARRQTTGSTP